MASVFGSVQYIVSGGDAVLKSSGVRALLASQGAAKAGRCTSLAANQARHSKERPQFATAPKTLTHVAAQAVYPANYAAGVANNKHNTLKEGCNA